MRPTEYQDTHQDRYSRDALIPKIKQDNEITK